MSCLTPLSLYHSDDGTTTFDKEKGFNPISVPCGQCLGCRIDHSRDWALRCMHHSKQFEKNCFITLTFDDEHLKDRKSVNVQDFQKFMYRLRSKLAYEGRPKIQYFHSTEYGEKTSRPHHHAILFNYYPPDAEPLKKVGNNVYYTSKELSDVWHHQGYIVVGNLTYQTAAYTAAYTFKKQRGKDYPEGITPEKMTCSQGIGVAHFLQYYKEYCELGHIIHDGKRFRIPRAYLKKLDVDDEEKKDVLMKLKLEREFKAKEDSILDREKKYRFLLDNQKKYKKKLYEDTPLSPDNRYLKQLRSLQLQIMEITGEYNPHKKEALLESVRSL